MWLSHPYFYNHPMLRLAKICNSTHYNGERSDGGEKTENNTVTAADDDNNNNDNGDIVLCGPTYQDTYTDSVT